MSKRNKCFDRKPFVDTLVIQDGYRWFANDLFTVQTKEIPNRMSKDCRYSIETVDAGCTGCIHNQREKNVT